MITSRHSFYGAVEVGTTETDSAPFPFQDAAGGFIHVPATEGAVTLTFYVADDDVSEPPNYQEALKYDGNAISVALIGGQSCEIHPSLFSAHRFKIVASAVSAVGIRYKITAKS